MVDQTYVDQQTNGRTDKPTRGMAGSMKELLHDIVLLSELQVSLLTLDLKQAAQRMALPGALIVAAVCLALGCFPVLLAALGFGLHTAGLPYWAAFLIAAGAGLLGSGLAAFLGGRWLQKELSVLQRSQAELKNNVAWLKSALRKREA